MPWLLGLLVLFVRLLHLRVVWVEEGYPLAAAMALRQGAWLYRDLWFDKPPVSALLPLLWGAQLGWPLRLAGAAYCLLLCWLVYRLALRWWGQTEARWAAALLAFALHFWLPAATMVLGPDLLLLAPMLLAVEAASFGRPVSAGLWCALALLTNSKALYLILLCAFWSALQGGWAAAAQVLLLSAAGQLLLLPVAADYWRQVWQWGFGYSRDTYLQQPWLEGLRRLAGWSGFHAALVLPALFALFRPSRNAPAGNAPAGNAQARNAEAAPVNPSVSAPLARLSQRQQLLCFWLPWLLFSLAAVAGGARFFPRYFLVLLPPVVLLAARGYRLLPSSTLRLAAAILLLIPLLRFAPGHWQAWQDTHRDLALQRDSKLAAAFLRANASAGDQLFVWGYRPDIYALSGLPPGTPFLDSQPVNGILADRHLISQRPTFAAWAPANQQRLTAARPVFVVDGLGALNPQLSLDAQPALAAWLQGYALEQVTETTRIYRRK